MLPTEPVIKRKAGRPPKDQPPPIPSYAELQLELKDREKQAESIRTDAYKLSKLLGRNILVALRSNDKIAWKDLVIPWGIASDKLLQGTESTGLELHVPSALVDKFVLALNVKQSGPLLIDKEQLP